MYTMVAPAHTGPADPLRRPRRVVHERPHKTILSAAANRPASAYRPMSASVTTPAAPAFRPVRKDAR
ncbi:hypothetical protein Axi01nite_64210 [Actinoplanes xinjiangensis]|nr:hypothetical protein Axi01nite_64210 [Actinoplanes xinjiangensis]